MVGLVPVDAEAEEKAIVPPPPGVRLHDLRRNMKIRVWWWDDWWAAKITHINLTSQRVSVRFIGDEFSTPGICPHHIKIM